MDAILLAALAAATWGTSAFFEKMGVTGGDPLGGVLARSVGVGAGCVVFALAWPAAARSFVRLPLKSALFFALGGAMASVLGQIFFYQALRKSEIGRVSAVGGAWPAVAFLLGMAFLGEPFSWKRAGGVVLVALGVFLIR
jgi:transporter family protein